MNKMKPNEMGDNKKKQRDNGRGGARIRKLEVEGNGGRFGVEGAAWAATKRCDRCVADEDGYVDDADDVDDG